MAAWCGRASSWPCERVRVQAEFPVEAAIEAEAIRLRVAYEDEACW